MNRTLLLAIALAGLRCDPGIEMDAVDLNTLYSVNAFISPQDSVYKVFLFRALEIGEVANEDLAAVEDATVVLSDGVDSDSLYLDATNHYYVGHPNKLKISASNTYYLLIQIKGGKKINASCVVPPTPELPQVSGIRTGDDFDFDVTWINPNHHHYFVLSAIADGKYPYISPSGEVLVSLNARLDERSLPSDSQMEVNAESGTVWRAFLAPSPKLTVRLSNVDANMFHFYETYSEYDNWLMNSSDQSGVPSFTQPKPIFSNINGGVGIFAASNTRSLTIEIK